MLTGLVIGALIGGVIGVVATAIAAAYGRDESDDQLAPHSRIVEGHKPSTPRPEE